MMFSNEDLETIHGVNERMTLENLERMIRFYIALMQTGAMQ